MTKSILSAFVLLSLTLHTKGQDQLFNDDWKFHKGDVPNAEKNMNDTATWRSITLPHDWSIEGPFSDEWASATAYLPGGIGWYKKIFEIPAAWSGKKVFIYFDGVYKNSTVWLNGHLLGNRPNGFISFEYELTKYLNRTGNNTLMVKVDHSDFGDSRWYTGSGIYRNVYLKIKDAVHITNWGVQFSAANISHNNADASLSIETINQSNVTQNIIIKYSLANNKGVEVAKGSQPVSLKQAVSGTKHFSFTINHPQLWSINDPALYSLSVTINRNNKVIDTYVEPVGIRSIRIDANTGFFLNDKSIKLKGVCIHDDAGALGVAVPEAVWRSRLQLLKEGGCNSVRMSHNPHADYMYRLCDELGLLIIDEAFDEWEFPKNKWIKGWNVGTPGKDGYSKYFAAWADIDVRDMILRNYNHPSIIAWSIGNEIDYPNDPYSSEVLSSGNNPQIYGRGYLPDHPPASRMGDLSKKLSAAVKKYDTTRPVTAALAGVVMSNTTTYPDNIDWVGYNYQEYRYADDHAKYPQRKIYGSENGMQLKAWNTVDSNQYIPGQYLWTGIDYLGEAGKWPQRSNTAGLIDLAGFAKPEYYFRQSLWSDKPMIYIGTSPIPKQEDNGIWSHKRAEPNWNFNDTTQLRVNCFTNCTEAELFLNGKSLGKKVLAQFPGHFIYWDIHYETGELKVIGYNNNTQIAENVLKTSGAAQAIKATVIKDEIGKTNIVQVPIHIVDKDGVPMYAADNEITATITGNAILLGLESGSSSSHEDYRSNKRKALHGKLIAYVMLQKNTGDVSVQLSSPGLQSQTVQLR
ncbi:MAG: glycoside hydrolase family 2 TIM barrel-domain containing protein [Agriterribacter sp.]